MKKICISLSALLALFMTACTEDYTVPNNLTVNNPESALAASDVTVTPAGATSLVIADFINEDGTDKQQLTVGNLKIEQSKIPSNSYLRPKVYLSMSSDFSGKTNKVYEVKGANMTDGTITISPSVLSKLYNDSITRRPDVVTIYLASKVDVITNKTSIATIGDSEGAKYFPLNAINFTPDAVIFESAYYYIGALTTNKKYQFTNASGGSFYDDPVITATIPALGDGWHWFRLAGESSFNADGSINWDLEGSNKTSICPVNQNDEGIKGKCINGTQSWHLIESSEFYAYRVTINLLDMTYTITGLKPIMYYTGDANGWSFSPLVKDNDGWYNGFYYIFKKDGQSTWGFKFSPEKYEGDWGKTYGWSDEGKYKLVLGDITGNLDLVDDNQSGFYQISVNPDELSYKLSPIEVLSIIGTAAGGWTRENDIDMKYDTKNRCWTVTADLAAGEYKIRANHEWIISWGVKNGGGFTTQGGATNMQLETAGKYLVKFAPEAEGYGNLTLELVE